MGFAVAEAAVRAGAEVTLIAGPVSLTTPRGARRIDVVTAGDMAAAVAGQWPSHDALFMVAAVADFVPREPASQKIKKLTVSMSLALEPAPDILAECGRTKRPEQILVGFAIETENEIANAREKLERKNLDMIVVNNPNTHGAAFEVDTNVVTIVTPDHDENLPLMSKRELANQLLVFADGLFVHGGKVRQV
jgi:phosphopantothenoylcysteine decarboxylase/phosphopantothenate--cysteine ligase